MSKKKIIIIGKNSYIGLSFREWLLNFPGQYDVQVVSSRNGEWKNCSFGECDVLLHVAGIAHVPTGSAEDSSYYEVNRDLALDVATKAKDEGVTQFIFLSSIIVYGDSALNNAKIINKNTIPSPANSYGKSKLQAEHGLKLLESTDFKVAVIRPPMIYGKNSKGNYNKLVRLATSLPIFPKVDNERSILHIDNLCEFIRLLINFNDSGVFLPQNQEYVRTSELVKLIGEFHGKKIWFTALFNPVLFILLRKVNVINKVFGSLVYEKSVSVYKGNYNLRNLKESILLTESKQ